MDTIVSLVNRAAHAWSGHAIGIAWQAAVLVLLLLLLDLALARRVRAVIRHAMWLLVLLKLLLPPGLAFPTSPWYWRPGVPASPGQKLVQSEAAPAWLTGAEFGEVPPEASAERFAHEEIVQSRVSPAAWLFFVWLAGGSLLAAYLARQSLRVRRMVATAVPASAQVREVYDRNAGRLGLRRRPPLLVSTELGTPSVCGLTRPVVVLPSGLAERLEPARLDDVFLHELAHVRRGDLWWSHLQAILLVFFWWHPLVWLTHSRLRRLAEEATDEAVVSIRRGDPAGYAETLIDVARAAIGRPILSLGLVGILEGRRSLHRRIERLISLPVPLSSSIGGRGWCALGIAGALLLPMARGEGGASPAPQSVATAGEDGRVPVIAGEDTKAPNPDEKKKIPDGIREQGSGGNAATFSPSAPMSESPGAKLRRKLETLRLEELLFQDVRLEEVIRWLKEEARRVDPEGRGLNFFLNPNLGAVDPPAPEIDPATGRLMPKKSVEPNLREVIIRIDPPLRDVRLIDAVDAITKSGTRPIHYAIEDYAVVFLDGTEPQLVTRVFRVNVNVFEEGLRSALGENVNAVARNPSGGAANLPGAANPLSAANPPGAANIPGPPSAIQNQVRTFFESAGVSLEPPNAVFFNDRLGLLMVRATTTEIEIVEQALNVLNAAPPMLQLDMRFLEVPRARLRELDLEFVTAAPSGPETVSSVLTPGRTKALLQALDAMADVRTVAMPRISTLSRREARLEIAPSTNAAAGDESPAPGPDSYTASVQVLPDVLADGRTIELKVTGELTEVGPVSASTFAAAEKEKEKTGDTATGVFAVNATGYVRHLLSTEKTVPDGHTILISRMGALGAPTKESRPERSFVLLVTPSLIDPAGNLLHPPTADQ